MSEQEPRCVGIRADGARCESVFGLNPTTGLCLTHDPERAELIADARSRGGLRTAELRRPDIPPAPRTLEEARDCAAWVAQAAAEGRLEPEAARVYVAALREFRTAYEKTEGDRRLREEMAEIRRRLRELKASRKGAAS